MKEGFCTMISASQIGNNHSIKSITELFHSGVVEIDNFEMFIDYINNVMIPTSDDIPSINFAFDFETNNIFFLSEFKAKQTTGHSYVYAFHTLKTVTKYIFEYLQFQTKRSQEKLYQQILKTFQSKVLNLYKKSVSPDSNFNNFNNNDILFFDLNEAGMHDYQFTLSKHTFSEDDFNKITVIASSIEEDYQLKKLFEVIFSNRSRVYDTFYFIMKILEAISSGLKDKSHMLDIIYFFEDRENNEFFKSLYLFFRTVSFEYNIDLKHIKAINDMMEKHESDKIDFISNIGEKPFANNRSFVKLLNMIDVKLPNQMTQKINILSQYSLNYYADIDFNNINNVYSDDQNFGILYIDDKFFKNSFIYHTEEKNVYHNFLTFITTKFDKLILSQKTAYMMNLKYLDFFEKDFDFSTANIMPNNSINNNALISDLNKIIGFSGQGLFLLDSDVVSFQKEYTLYPVKIGL